MPIHRKHRRGEAPLADARPARTSAGTRPDALLVGLRETDETHGVLNVAELLARKKRINAHLIGIADQKTTLNNRRSSDRHDGSHDHDREWLRARTKRRLHQTLGRAVYWSTDGAFGTLAAVLADEVRRRRPRFILLAAGPSRTSQRRHARAVLRATNAVDAPVLVVPPHQDVLPTRVLVATDFSQSSKRAALAAISLMGPRGHLTLVHVEPARKSDTRGDAARPDSREQRISRCLRELRSEIDKEARRLSPNSRSHSIVKQTLLLRGQSDAAILDCAAERQSDLIVIGSRRLSKNGSMPRGSVAIGVLVGAGCAVLVAPPSGQTVK